MQEVHSRQQLESLFSSLIPTSKFSIFAISVTYTFGWLQGINTMAQGLHAPRSR